MSFYKSHSKAELFLDSSTGQTWVRCKKKVYAETRNRFQENACPNTCDELGAAERIEAERLAKLAEEGLQIKADLIQRGKDLK